MTRTPRKLQITRQQKHLLLLALFLLKYLHGATRPPKRQVLKFIAIRNLLTIRPEDMQKVSTGEESWANDIAFRRADLKAEGCLAMPSQGEWQITPTGEEQLMSWCVILHYFMTAHPDWEERLDRLESIFEEKVVITKDTVKAANEAFEIGMRIFPDKIPELPEEVQGKIRL